MKAVQNYPGDYDGAVCFYPVLYWVLKVLMDARNAEILEQIGQAGWIGEETDRQILKATMDLCDGLDGALDGVISDSKAAAKKQGEVLKAVKKIVSGEQYQMLETLALPMTLPFPLAYGEVSLPGYQVFEGASSLFHFEFLNMAHDAGAVSISDSLIANVFAQDPDFDTRRFEPQEWRERIQEISRWMDAYSTDLDAFAKKGGKMILVQGTVDPQVTSYGTIWFYEKLLKKYGKERLDSFLKFYLAPGYGHGADGTFLITSDFLGALDRWVEKEQVPKTMIVKDIHPDTKGRTRPLYEYPGYPYYAGAGDIDRAESYFRKE